METKNDKTEQEVSYKVEVVDFEDKYAEAFCDLNKEWITTYFKLEESDLDILSNPRKYVIDNGGRIFVGLLNGQPLGVCALYKIDEPPYDYELAKFAVSPKAQGHGLGNLLCETLIKTVKELGGKRIFIDTNSRLKPAIHLYKKYGFRELPELIHTNFERVDVQMELVL